MKPEYLPLNKDSPPYNEWLQQHRQARAFLLNGVQAFEDYFNKMWAEGDAASNYEYDDLGDVFFESIHEVHPTSAYSSLAWSALSLACTAYETLVERSAYLILNKFGLTTKFSEIERSWTFNQASKFYSDLLSFEIRPTRVELVITVRNVLTHGGVFYKTREGNEKFNHLIDEIGISSAPNDDEKSLGLVPELDAQRDQFERVITPVESYRMIDILREHAVLLGEQASDIAYRNFRYDEINKRLNEITHKLENQNQDENSSSVD